jgi:pimeloyl-ACP methyl ester carboxylesterase
MELRLPSPAFFWPINSTIVRSTKQLIGLTATRLRLRLLRSLSRQHAETVATRLFLTPPRHHFPDEELAALEEAKLISIPLMSGRMTAWRWGDEQAPHIVLVHGWGGRGTQLHHFVRPLLERGFAVVAFDAPGHGMSAGTESSMLHFLGALEVLLGKIGPVHALIGHSMGGAVVASALSRGVQVQRAVLLAAPASLIDASRRFADVLRLPESFRAALQQQIQNHFGAPWNIFEAEHGATTHPLLVIHDDTDREVPVTDAGRYLAAWPQARLLATSGLGHRRLLRDKDVLARAVAFVAESGL